ncbi:MerR family transcriptional regulator [Arachnia propionica]|uniref:MerR family transcriptional regulator n=1 Tax=Arachnia propionica TaxID=1750 RepID=A0A3P1TCE7_9ACTN|nr:MerR family transcriptional regulator [Arachnia propionica]MDO5083711.1 MerR family transcriptional regulator [Arachnia propionica]RRD07132.1 MerR family transcriptional regulator [Arachnia propionica]
MASKQDSLQETLFEGDFAPVAKDLGFRGPIAHRVAGITYRQLDYWARTGLVVPELRDAKGSGSQRLYSFRDILLLRVVKRFLDVGISLQQIRVAIDHLRARGVEDITEITLVSDGFSVYECTSANELFDLTRGGQGMFLISVASVWHEIEGTLNDLPKERVTEASMDHPGDELASRRRAKAV